MENPFAPKHDSCTPCDGVAGIDIKKCHNDDPRLLVVSIAGVASALVFMKETVRVINNTQGCAPDVFTVKGGNKPSIYAHVVMTGKMVYASEMDLHFPPKPKKHTIELDPATTTINGTSFESATLLADALQAIVADCECTCEDTPPPPPIHWFKIVGLGRDRDDMKQLLVLLESSGLKNFKLMWNPPLPDIEGETGCLNQLELPFGIGQQYLLGQNGITTFTVEDCTGNMPSKSFTASGDSVVLGPAGLFNLVLNPTLPTCGGTLQITAFATEYLSGVSVNLTTGEVTIPFQVVGGPQGYVGLAFTCNGELVATHMYTVTNPASGLRMTFTNLGNMPTGISDPADLTQWNTLFNLPAYGNAFDSIYAGGNMVILSDAGIDNITEMPAYLFSSGGLVDFSDWAFTVKKVGALAFSGSGVQNVYVANATTIGSSAFVGCAALKSVNAQSATSIGSYAFQNCVSLNNINIQSVTDLGVAANDASVFDGITGLSIKIRVPIALQTADGGNMHASLAYLDANNTVFFTWV